MKNNEEVLSIVYKKRDSLKFEINNKGLVVVLNKQDYKIQNFLRKCKFNIPEYKKIEFDEKIASICANQRSPEEFKNACQAVIDNSGAFEDTQKQIDEQLGR